MQPRARKRFGQNFLHDEHIIDRIIHSVGAKPGQHVVEIGPGRGALTQGLIDSGATITALEIDRDLAPNLLLRFGLKPNFSLHQTDALRFDFAKLAAPGDQLRVVGNLPYNISTPLIFHLLQHCGLITDMYFMLQKEVVERMAAAPGGRDYGRLSVMVQYQCEVSPLFHVAPDAFHPAPKVDSAVVQLRPRSAPQPQAEDIATLGKVVNAAFQQRRKTLRNALKGIITQEALNSLAIDSKIRAENLSIADFVSISNWVSGVNYDN
jgi:16S rRNA (adenine1518-N6/adenine1519-N6)-dimethyltransferase